MDRIVVHGGARLCGEVAVSGSKNSTLALMAAALLADGETLLRRVPRLRNVDAMLELLRALGAGADWDAVDPHAVRIDARRVTNLVAPYDIVRKMRAPCSRASAARASRNRAAAPSVCGRSISI